MLLSQFTTWHWSGKVKVRVTSKSDNLVDSIKVYKQAHYHACINHHDRDQTFTQRFKPKFLHLNMTLNRRVKGQGHKQRLQHCRTHQGFNTCKVSSLFQLPAPRANFDTKFNQNYCVTLNRKSQDQELDLLKLYVLIEDRQKVNIIISHLRCNLTCT